ncbi:Alpha/beta hydrolase family protein [Planctomycetes bacterium Pan216]|uniref:Alpha/beta hydrolase family protein n=1 Tax=Kolteria novifilia TaxID=2527975 RepID=A0A518BCZ9_9BACT|nr:Alpha/beta hydrolase family protein [Planctomycetes bacterium Pan216]
MIRRPYRRHVLVLLLAGLSIACSPGVHVRTVRTDTMLAKMRANVLNSGSVSPRTMQLLSRYDLKANFRRDPIETLSVLDGMVREEPNQELAFAMAELSFDAARRAERRHPEQSLGLYFGTVAYAYYYLFDPTLPHNDTAQFDPQYRLTCDLYNRALAKCIRLAQKTQKSEKSEHCVEDKMNVEFGDGGIEIEITRHGFLWNAEEFGPFLFANDYEVQGLENRYHTYGLGVPLICERRPREAVSPQDKFYPERTSFPVTAFLRMDGGLCDAKGCRRHATLELHDPLRSQSIEVAGQVVPLESNLTAPLGFHLAETRLERLELKSLLRPGSVADRTGLYMLEPYDPEKIPVVMVHGLWSSPLIWMTMFNDLRGDPKLRERYQFWFFLYPTGNPIPYSAGSLRKVLTDVRQSLDPDQSDETFEQMVLVGHSMGGILAKMMVQESGSDLWNLVSTQPFETINATPEERERLQRIFFYHREPYVRRVVFVATPHRGSELAVKPLGRLGSALISLPKTVTEVGAKLAQRNPGIFNTEFEGNLPTSVDTLSPESPIIQVVAELKRDDELAAHSIIGDISGTTPEKGTDGVVPYTSAHLEDVDSEYIVPASHSDCLAHPLTVLEVRRILLEHLESVDAKHPIQLLDHREPASDGSEEPKLLPAVLK